VVAVTKKTPKPATPEQLLQNSPTRDYEPRGYYGVTSFLGTGRPPFNNGVIAAMLTDPRVIYGLWLLKGPIVCNAHVKVKSDNEQVRQFIIDQINRLWSNLEVVKIFKAVEWGYSGSEVLYREKDGLVQIDTLRDFHTPDVKPVVLNGSPIGMTVRTPGAQNDVYLGFPKSILHLHWRERNRFYGLSRLFGAHVPWWEIWSDGGYRDIRRLWFYKNSFEGGILRHPPGSSQTDTGQLKANRDIARELIEKKRAGGLLTLPNTPSGEGGGYAWDYEPPTANVAPDGLLEYGQTLGDEILEALGIPPEVISSGGDQGFGSSTGRQVPQLAFYSILQELFQWLLTDIDTCILRPLTESNFGPGSAVYDLLPFNLSEDVSEGSAGSELQPEGFNGNQFQDENQRAPTQMSHYPRLLVPTPRIIAA
jgi:hypothetical protein